MRQKYSIGPVWFLMFACAFFTSCVTQGKKVQQDELSQYVEPRIGTAMRRTDPRFYILAKFSKMSLANM